MALLVGPAVTPGGMAEGDDKTTSRKHAPLPADVETSLPDWEEDPKLTRELKCNGAFTPRATPRTQYVSPVRTSRGPLHHAHVLCAPRCHPTTNNNISTSQPCPPSWAGAAQPVRWSPRRWRRLCVPAAPRSFATSPLTSRWAPLSGPAERFAPSTGCRCATTSKGLTQTTQKRTTHHVRTAAAASNPRSHGQTHIHHCSNPRSCYPSPHPFSHS